MIFSPSPNRNFMKGTPIFGILIYLVLYRGKRFPFLGQMLQLKCSVTKFFHFSFYLFKTLRFSLFLVDKLYANLFESKKTRFSFIRIESSDILPGIETYQSSFQKLKLYLIWDRIFFTNLIDFKCQVLSTNNRNLVIPFTLEFIRISTCMTRS